MSPATATGEAPPVPDGLIEAPAPGVYPDTPMDEYLRWWAASSSVLTALLRSPAHARVEMERTPDEEDGTRATNMGTALHVAVLEPERFEEEYALEPDITGGEFSEYNRPRATKTYKEQVAAMEAHGLTVLTTEDMRVVESVTEAVRSHESAHVLLDGPGPAEASIVWEDPETGVPVKIRPDWICEDVGAVVDLKSTRDAAPESFRKDFFRLGYHRKAAGYLKGCQAAGYDVQHFTFLAVEKEPPWATAVYRVRDDVIEWAWMELRAQLNLFARCWENDEWPAYGRDVQYINLPPWAYDRIEEREARLEAMV